jgi:hypothetical protein
VETLQTHKYLIKQPKTNKKKQNKTKQTKPKQNKANNSYNLSFFSQKGLLNPKLPRG